MSTQARRGRSTDPLWKRRARALPVLLAIVLATALLIGGGVYWFSGDDGEVAGSGKPNGASFSVGYAGSASRLRDMAKQEATEQLRDWARYGLAARLGMDTGGYRDSSYDTLPVRDPGFDGLVRQANGPGRSLFDGDRDTLHVLVPAGDRHRRRTVAMEIDQHRTDAGSDPRRVQVHEYEVRPGAESIRVTAGKAEPTAKVRAAHGYVTGRVDTAGGLKSFLARADRLSSLRRQGSKVLAAGWSWRGGKPLVDAEDVSVLQRGHASGRLPGFSLDPEKARTAEDLRAALPGLSAELAGELADGKQPEGLARRVSRALFEGEGLSSLKDDGVPTRRAQLHALDVLLRGGGAYSQARYEGGLAGTEAGMTLFYTDYVAKQWVTGAGAGVPSKAVEGFVPDSRAGVPWGECPESPEEGTESGRIWFGPDSSGFSHSGDRVDLGARTTRLFIRTFRGAGEAEAGYSFGRGTRWWDRHYQDVADYEPQYERLDELMRWSGALAWLSSKAGGAGLPTAGEGRGKPRLRFQDWYARHDELRERGRIEFVDPPSADEEALQYGVSRDFEQCGFHNVRGGVSLAGESAARTRPELPPDVRRAGEFAPGTALDASDGTGRIEQVFRSDVGEVTDRVERTFSRGEDGSAVVRAEGGARESEHLGSLRRTYVNGPGREVSSRISAGGGEVRQDVGTSGRQLGEMVADRTPDGVSLRWERGLVDRFRSAALTVQERLAKGKKPVPGADDALYEYRAEGRSLYKTGGEDAPWFSYTKGGKADDAVLAVRLGAPSKDTGGPEFSTAALVPGPGGKGPGAPRGPPGGSWIEAEPPGPGRGRPATVRPAGEPRERDSGITVETSDGSTATLHDAGGRARAKADDPVLGLDGTAAGAALMTHYPRVRAAMREAERSGDGLYRAVELGPDGADGIALAGAGKKIVLFESGYDWAGRLQQALRADTSRNGPLIRYEKGGEPRHVSKNKLEPRKDGAHRMRLEDVPRENPGVVYAGPRLAAQLSGGKHELPHYAPSRGDLAVVVVPAEVVAGDAGSGERRDAGPDVYRYGGEDWTRIGPPRGGGPGGGGDGGDGRDGGAGSGGSAAARGPLPAKSGVVIVCTERESEDPDSVCHTGDD